MTRTCHNRTLQTNQEDNKRQTPHKQWSNTKPWYNNNFNHRFRIDNSRSHLGAEINLTPRLCCRKNTNLV